MLVRKLPGASKEYSKLAPPIKLFGAPLLNPVAPESKVSVSSMPPMLIVLGVGSEILYFTVTDVPGVIIPGIVSQDLVTLGTPTPRVPPP